MQFVIRLKNKDCYDCHRYIHRTQSYNNVLWTDDIDQAQVYTEAGAKSCVRQRKLQLDAEIVQIHIIPTETVLVP